MTDEPTPKEQAIRMINAHILQHSEEIEYSASKMLEKEDKFTLPKNVSLNSLIKSIVSRLYDCIDDLASEGREKKRVTQIIS